MLLVVIYIAFIGLGVPDSLFGAAWPAIRGQFELPVSAASLVTLLSSGSTAVCTLFSGRLIRRFGTPHIVVFSTALTALALFGFSTVDSLSGLCLCAVPLGLGAGAIDTALNHYVALHCKPAHMNFMHCFYGIGVSASPYLLSLALAGGSWRGGYRLVAGIQSGIALLTLLSLPLWPRRAAETPADGAPRTGTRGLLRDRRLWYTFLIFIGSCGLEYTAGVWGSSFLVEARGLSAASGARLVTVYYGGMALGRFLSGLFSERFSAARLIACGQAVTLCALVLLLAPGPAALAGCGLFLVGLGNGPLFPCMLRRTPQLFGVRQSSDVMGLQMASTYVGVMLAPAAFGALARAGGVGWFGWYLAALFLVMMTGQLLLGAGGDGRR